jgi:uncharacterized membrane protein
MIESMTAMVKGRVAEIFIIFRLDLVGWYLLFC